MDADILYLLLFVVMLVVAGLSVTYLVRQYRRNTATVKNFLDNIITGATGGAVAYLLFQKPSELGGISVVTLVLIGAVVVMILAVGLMHYLYLRQKPGIKQSPNKNQK